MGIVIRQSLKSTIVTYAGTLLGTVNVLWLYPKFFTTQEVGLIRLLQDMPILMAVFLQLGAANISDRFFVYFKNESQKNNGILFALLIYPLFGFSLFCCYYYFFSDFLIGFYKNSSPLLVDYFIFILPIGFFMMYASVLEAYCRANLRIVVPSIIRELFLRFFMAAITISYAMKWIHFDQFICLFCLMYGLNMILLIVYLKQLKKLFIKPDFRIWNSDIINKIKKYALYIVPGTAGSLIASKIDTLMLASMTDLSYTGIYSIAFYIGTVVEIPKRSLSQITIPFISTYWNENNIEKIDELYKKTSINLFAAGALTFLLIWCSIDELFSLIPNSETYRVGKYVVLFIGITKLFDLVTSINGELILYSKYYRFNLILIFILALMTICTNLYLIPLYKIEGAAIALMITIFIFNLIKTGFLWYKFSAHPFSLGTLKILIIAVITYFSVFFIHIKTSGYLENILVIGLKSSIIICLYIVLILYTKVSSDINNIYHQVIRKIFYR